MNRCKLVSLSTVLATALTAVAARDVRAQETAEPGESREHVTYPGEYVARLGPQLGARVGYSAGTGVVYSGLDVSSASGGALPIIIDLGWRFLPQLYAGVYGQFAPVFLKTNAVSCPDGFSCSAQDWRMGVEADLHFLPRIRLDPYVGLSGGYEILHTNINGTMSVPTAAGAVPASVNASIVDRGWEFASLSLGFDYRANDVIGIGPFVSATLGEYNVHSGTQTVTAGGTQLANGPVASVDHAGHELLIAGLRGTFNP